MKKHRQTTETPVPPTTGSIAITVTEPERMKAIVSLARAIERLSAALAEPTQVTIKDCSLTSAGGSGALITINPE